MSGTWGTVCDAFWSSTDARVVCRQMGFSSSGTNIKHRNCAYYKIIILNNIILLHYNIGAVARINAYYGQGTAPILLDNVGCSGTESRLIDCTYDSNTTDCSHSDDAGARCQVIAC